MTAIRNAQGIQDRPAASHRDHDAIAAGKINGARTALEGEIRDLVRRNVAPLRPAERDAVAPPHRAEPDHAAATDPSTQHVNALIKQVSGASIAEIERVIHELNGVRDMLRGEGDRVTREIAGFASLSHAAITSMRVIAESLTEWKHGAQVRHDARN